MKNLLLTIVSILLCMSFFMFIGCSNIDTLPKDAVDYESCAFTLNDSETGYIFSQSYKLFAKEPEGVLYIPEEYKGLPVLETDSFSCSHQITKIIGCKNLENIEKYAFACTCQETLSAGKMQLKEIIFSAKSNLKNVGDYAFHKCSKLETAVFGEKISEFGMGAFYGCKILRNLTIYNPTPPKGAGDLFNEVVYKFYPPENFVVYVSETAVETYRNSEWGKYTIKAIEK